MFLDYLITSVYFFHDTLSDDEHDSSETSPSTNSTFNHSEFDNRHNSNYLVISNHVISLIILYFSWIVVQFPRIIKIKALFLILNWSTIACILCFAGFIMSAGTKVL